MRITKSPLYRKSLRFCEYLPSRNTLLYRGSDAGSEWIHTSTPTKGNSKPRDIDFPQGYWEYGVISSQNNLIYLVDNHYIIHAFSPTGITEKTDSLWIFDPSSIEEVHKKGYTSMLSISLSPDGRYLLTTHSQGYLIYDTKEKYVAEKKSVSSFVLSSAFSYGQSYYKTVVCSETLTFFTEYMKGLKI